MHDLAPAQPEVKPTWHDSSSKPSVPTMASIACVVVRRLPCIASGKQARVSVLVVGRIDGQHDVVLAEREEPLARVHAQHREGLASGARTLDGVLHVARALFGPVAQQRCTWPCQPPLHRTINLPNCGTLRGAYETNPARRISVRSSSATAPSAATPASQYTASQGVAPSRPRVNAVRQPSVVPVPALLLALQHCPNCGGELEISAAILESAVIERILTQLGLQARAPSRADGLGGRL